MKLKFKKQLYQTAAVSSVTNCFKGQPPSSGVKYRIDPGSVVEQTLFEAEGFKNEDLRISVSQLLENVRSIKENKIYQSQNP